MDTVDLSAAPPMMALDEYDVKWPFGMAYFINFLKKNNVVAIALASIFSDRINEITSVFVNDLIMPIINRDADGDGKKDIATLENKQVKIAGMTFNIGKFAVALIKFSLVTGILYIFYLLMDKQPDAPTPKGSPSAA